MIKEDKGVTLSETTTDKSKLRMSGKYDLTNELFTLF